MEAGRSCGEWFTEDGGPRRPVSAAPRSVQRRGQLRDGHARLKQCNGTVCVVRWGLRLRPVRWDGVGPHARGPRVHPPSATWVSGARVGLSQALDRGDCPLSHPTHHHVLPWTLKSRWAKPAFSREQEASPCSYKMPGLNACFAICSVNFERSVGLPEPRFYSLQNGNNNNKDPQIPSKALGTMPLVNFSSCCHRTAGPTRPPGRATGPRTEVEPRPGEPPHLPSASPLENVSPSTTGVSICSPHVSAPLTNYRKPGR